LKKLREKLRGYYPDITVNDGSDDPEDFRDAAYDRWI